MRRSPSTVARGETHSAGWSASPNGTAKRSEREREREEARHANPEQRDHESRYEEREGELLVEEHARDGDARQADAGDEEKARPERLGREAGEIATPPPDEPGDDGEHEEAMGVGVGAAPDVEEGLGGGAARRGHRREREHEQRRGEPQRRARGISIGSASRPGFARMDST